MTGDANFLTRHPTASRLFTPLVGVSMLVALTWLYLVGSPAFTPILTAMASEPFVGPFIDWEWMPSAAECWAKGVDVYVDNTCFLPLPHGQHAYSPLWLRATFLPVGPAWTAGFGFGLAALYFAIIACMPAPRTWSGLIFILLTGISCSSFFAIERGNADLLMFGLTAVGAALWGGSLVFRLLGYSAFLTAGLLKFYPMVLLGLTVRERSRTFLLIALALVAFVGSLAFLYLSELRTALGNIPEEGYFNNLIGAKILPYGFASLLVKVLGDRLTAGSFMHVLLTVVLPAGGMLFLLVATVWRGWWLAGAGGVRRALTGMSAWEANMLVAGSVLICGCFFAGRSLPYRGIMLMLVLPGLLRLIEILPNRRAAWMMSATCVAFIMVGWIKLAQYCLNLVTASGSMPRAVQWLVNELAWWWWIIGTLASVIISLLLEAPFLQAVFSAVTGRARMTRIL